MSTTHAPRICGCGCGADVKRRYLPGHDAAHKSAIKMAARHARTRQAADRAINQALALGWEAHIDLPVLRGYVVRNRQGSARIHLDVVEVFLVDSRGDHHARANCRCLTACAKTDGMVSKLTRLATEAAFVRVVSTPALVADLKAGWSCCPECTVDYTLDEIVEWVMVGRQTTMDACEAAEMTTQGNQRKAVLLDAA